MHEYTLCVGAYKQCSLTENIAIGVSVCKATITNNSMHSLFLVYQSEYHPNSFANYGVDRMNI